MKKLVMLGMLSVIGVYNAQKTDAFTGRGDQKVQIGVNAQDLGTGIMASLDYGLGESFSFGIQAGYLLGTKELNGDTVSFGDRIDIRARANANIGSIIGFPKNMDLYPGLDLGLKNFGGHVGFRFFFEKGFGLFAETQFPIAKYNKGKNDFDYLNNQFNVSAGVSFDITKK